MKPKSLAQMIHGKRVLTIAPTESVRQACIVMATANISALPVVNGSGALIGMVSERDVIRRSIIVYRPSTETPVADIMTRDPFWLPPDAKPRQASEIMRKGKFRHLPVCQNRHVIGIVSLRDFDGRGNPISANAERSRFNRLVGRAVREATPTHSA